MLTIVDHRPLIRVAGTLRNAYALSLLQAETLAAAAVPAWPVRFGNPESTTVHVGRAAQELGLDLAVRTL